jgi:hypothetical protein
MRHIAGLGGADMQGAHNARSSTRPLPQFLIANARLEFSLNSRKQTHLKISNRERMAISAVARTQRGSNPALQNQLQRRKARRNGRRAVRVSSRNLYVTAALRGSG